jgi:RNA polymerase sigma-70 factor (family 1)
MKYKGEILAIDSKELKAFFKKYFSSIYIFAEKFTKDEMLAKDIAQEIFIKTWESSSNFENENALRAYLYLSARNQCINHFRKNESEHANESHYNQIHIENNYLDEIAQEETFRLLDIAIQELPPQGKRIIELTLKGLGNHEIAKKLHISINTLKTHKLRAYRTLRSSMGSYPGKLL